VCPFVQTLIKVDKDHNRRVEFPEWMDYMGSLCAQMDDMYFNKAVNNMIAAAQKSKEEAKAKLASGVAAASAGASAGAAAAPAAGSAAAGSAAFHQKGEHGHHHGHSHK
jgi:hypothetical protein